MIIKTPPPVRPPGPLGPGERVDVPGFGPDVGPDVGPVGGGPPISERDCKSMLILLHALTTTSIPAGT